MPELHEKTRSSTETGVVVGYHQSRMNNFLWVSTVNTLINKDYLEHKL